MASDIPAGWYPDIHGTIRWWDGQRWTEHVREPGSSTAAPGAASVDAVRTPEPPSTPETNAATEPATTEASFSGATNGTAASTVEPAEYGSDQDADSAG